MSKTFIPKGYKSELDLYQTQKAIGRIKSVFANELCKKLDLIRVSAPLFVDPTTGLNDNLNGVERAVEFDIAETKTNAQVVHSLAKWKRYALKAYGFEPFKGLYTDMNAIRRDEELDNLHSVYVDQWDWEKIITKETRTLEYLKKTVIDIVAAICDVSEEIKKEFGLTAPTLSKEVSFITTQELEDMYPDCLPKERENKFIATHPTAFIMQIGDLLKSGVKHDGRSPDYDDWSLNGDIVFYNELLDCAFEISSMGIRVDEKALSQQLAKAGCEERKSLPFHKALLAGELPLTMGGGIGQSRLCMLLLSKAHIGEVQCSVWDEKTVSQCAANGIKLL